MSKWTVKTIHDYLAQWAPPHLAENWDNVGLQVGALSTELSGVLVSLDITEAVLWEAVHKNTNLIVTHHPLLFQAVKCIDDSKASTRLLRLAIQMDLNVLSFHTNLDATQGGLNDLLAKKLSLTQTKALIPSANSKNLGRSQTAPSGLGRVGKISKTNLAKLTKKTAKALQIKNLRTVGNADLPIHCVAVMTGSGGGFFQEAKEAGAQALITGDVKYHHALDAFSEGVGLIDIGHFAGEIGMVSLVANRLKKFLKQKKSKLPVLETESQQDPFEFWNL